MRRTIRSTRVRIVLARVGHLLITVAGVALAIFTLVRIIPGDPALTILGTRATPESLAALRAELHLDQPFHAQLAAYLGDLIRGDLGHSLVQGGRPVFSIVMGGLAVTLVLTALTVILSLLFGGSAGLTIGVWRRPLVDSISRSAATALLAVPPFLAGFLLLLAVSGVPWIAPLGGGVSTGIAGLLHRLWLPSVALTCFLGPIIFRTVRQAARDVMSEEFIEAAVVRGLSPLAVATRHVLPNAIIPVIAVLGVSTGGLLGGAIVVETVFNLPGLGRVLVQAVGARDYPVVQGAALITAFCVVLISTSTEIITRILDPRVGDS